VAGDFRGHHTRFLTGLASADRPPSWLDRPCRRPGLPHQSPRRGRPPPADVLRRRGLPTGAASPGRVRVPVLPLSQPARSGPARPRGPGDRISGPGVSQPPVPWRRFGMSKTMISRWPAEISVGPLAVGRKRNPAAYRILNVCRTSTGQAPAAWRVACPGSPTRPHPLLSRGPDAGTMAQSERRTKAIAASDPPPYTVYGRSKKNPNTATLCHFWARPVRRLGGKYRGSSRSGAGV
jgi:hypothetical protein